MCGFNPGFGSWEQHSILPVLDNPICFRSFSCLIVCCQSLVRFNRVYRFLSVVFTLAFASNAHFCLQGKFGWWRMGVWGAGGRASELAGLRLSRWFCAKLAVGLRAGTVNCRADDGKLAAS
jgi:hypothetical protein